METYPFEVKPLPYPIHALEPQLDARTMTLHHDKHYASYVDALNHTLQKFPRYQGFSLTQLLSCCLKLPQEAQTAVRRSAGGVYNHELYFAGMAPHSNRNAFCALSIAIDQCFGSFERFHKQFAEAGKAVFGSGWVSLSAAQNGRLFLEQLPNQDTSAAHRATSILLLDCWEHAYYLEYQSRRAEYIEAWFSIISWEQAERRYLAARIYPGQEADRP